jgi:hypothetical protein
VFTDRLQEVRIPAGDVGGHLQRCVVPFHPKGTRRDRQRIDRRLVVEQSDITADKPFVIWL